MDSKTISREIPKIWIFSLFLTELASIILLLGLLVRHQPSSIALMLAKELETPPNLPYLPRFLKMYIPGISRRESNSSESTYLPGFLRMYIRFFWEH